MLETTDYAMMGTGPVKVVARFGSGQNLASPLSQIGRLERSLAPFPQKTLESATAARGVMPKIAQLRGKKP